MSTLRRALLTLTLPAAMLAGGCGDVRTAVPVLTGAATPRKIERFSFPTAGVSFRAPANWNVGPGSAPLVASAASGNAMVAIWRYPRTEPLPSTSQALAQARDELVRAAHARDRTLRVIRVLIVRFEGHDAIELAATEHVAGHATRVRSIHVFAYRSEIVLDSYAPVDLFHAVDHSVFSPLKRSLRIGPAVARR